MNILTTKGPFLCLHFTVLRNLAEPKLVIRVRKRAIHAQIQGTSTPSFVNDVWAKVGDERIQCTTGPD